ncbi:hypothetical protein PFISCL1PPCAC_16209, partial [Pristionchus fissidentatus]
QMDATPSSSTAGSEQELDASGLASLVSNESLSLCILDCRSNGTPIRRATRASVPQIMLRRMAQGTCSLATLNCNLDAPGITIVMVPELRGGNAEMCRILRESLKKYGLSLLIFTGDVDDAIRAFPTLMGEEVKQKDASGFAIPSPLKPLAAVNAAAAAKGGEPAANDVSWHLKSLTIEPEVAAPPERHKQVFPVQINEHLYLGNKEIASNKDFLNQIGITHVVNVTKNLDNFFENDGTFRYLRIPVDDNSSFNLSAFFPEAISFIESAAASGGKVLVHCLAGISRSVTVCIAYLMSSHRWPLEHAYDQVLRCNGSIAPNFHFMGQLSEFERKLCLTEAPRSAPPLSPACAVEVNRASFFPPPPSPSFKE